MTGTVVVVGSINVDLTVRTNRWPQPGETILGGELAISPGGKGANQAVAAARMGAQVAMVGAVGNDAYQSEALRCLRDADVDLDAIATSNAATGVAIITVGPDGDNTIVVTPGANQTLDRAGVRTYADVIAAAEVCVLQMEIPPSGIQAAAELVQGRLVVNFAPIIDIDPAVLRQANPLVVNEHEAAAAARLLAQFITDPIVATDPTDVEGRATAAERDTMRALISAGVRSAVITLGERGAIACAGPGEPIVEVAAHKVAAVDTTGAGDAFVGALSASLARGVDLVESCREATRVSAFSVQRYGAQPSYPAASDLT